MFREEIVEVVTTFFVPGGEPQIFNQPRGAEI